MEFVPFSIISNLTNTLPQNTNHILKTIYWIHIHESFFFLHCFIQRTKQRSVGQKETNGFSIAITKCNLQFRIQKQERKILLHKTYRIWFITKCTHSDIFHFVIFVTLSICVFLPFQNSIFHLPFCFGRPTCKNILLLVYPLTVGKRHSTGIKRKVQVHMDRLNNGVRKWKPRRGVHSRVI